MKFCRESFIAHLRFFALWVPIGALPSAVLALLVSASDQSRWLVSLEVAAAVAVFIAILSMGAACVPALRDRTSGLSRALRITVVARGWLSLLIGIGAVFLPNGNVFILPDLATGLVAASGIGWMLGIDYGRAGKMIAGGAFLISLLDGLLIVFLMMMFGFFTLLFLHMKDRRRGRGVLPEELP